MDPLIKFLIFHWPVVGAGVFSILVVTYRRKGKKPLSVEEVGTASSEKGAEVKSYRHALDNFNNADSIDRVEDSDPDGTYKKVQVKYGMFRFEIFGVKNKEDGNDL